MKTRNLSAREFDKPWQYGGHKPVAQVSKPAVSPISKSAACGTVSGPRKFGNLRYSRLGSLRYSVQYAASRLGIAVLLCVTASAFAAASDPTPLLTQSADKLVAVLKSNGSRKDKADACRELAVVGNSKAVPVLARLLADEELSHMARYALETIPGSNVDRALRSELKRLKGRPLVGVIGSLGVRKDPKAVKPLSSLLHDNDSDVAQAAARALGNIGTTKAARAIEDALPTTAPANRLAFCEGLFRCAENLAANGKTKDAIALYDRLRGMTDVPHQVRAGALRGAIIARGQGRPRVARNDRLASDAGAGDQPVATPTR
jgi:hypothetical protein